MFYAVLFDHTEGESCRIQKGVITPTDTLYQFSLYDGDDQLMFTGVCTDNSSFDPLDYMQGRFGCTRIDYLDQRTGTWEML